MTDVSHAQQPAALGRAARGAVLWGSGFTLLRDVVQFAMMLVLVRILSADDYGRAGLAQAVLGMISVVSFKALAPHALQLRDPATIDWQAHFTAGAMINLSLFVLTIFVAGLLSLTKSYAGAAAPLAVLSLVLLIEIPSNLRFTMAQVAHDWARLQALLFAGTILGAVAALAVAMLGGGVWALIVPVPLLVAPAAFDLFHAVKWRPDWSWSWARYRNTARFGLTRMGSAGPLVGRQLVEQMMLAGMYDFASLGIFGRAIGLATMTAGRIGPEALSSLYPVITRAERGSDRFQRIAGLVIRGVAWMTIPAAAFLALLAPDIVSLLYGPRWTDVSVLLPLAAAHVTFGSIAVAAYSLLLANDHPRACLMIDVASSGVGVALIFLFMPFGPQFYLAALTVQGAAMLTIILVVLCSTGGIWPRDILAAILPPLAAAAGATAAVIGLRAVLPLPSGFGLSIGFEGLFFVLVFATAARLCFPGLLRELLCVAPGGAHINRFMLLR
jgi:O-antigen/teichoic acid export membrane protein